MSLRTLPLALCASLLAFAAGAADNPAPTTSYLLKTDRVFDARSERTCAPRRTPYLLSVYQPDGPMRAPAVLETIMRDVNAVRQEMTAAGAWAFSAGLYPPSTATWCA